MTYCSFLEVSIVQVKEAPVNAALISIGEESEQAERMICGTSSIFGIPNVRN